ncbi:MAG: hypothetical protein IT445_16135 [Phycisphaeraceae bacterium]|nr:hypothetical protein [Phycisphaeraceae bacterium]
MNTAETSLWESLLVGGLLLLALVFGAMVAAAAQAQEAAVNPGAAGPRDRFLLLDERIVAEAINAKLVLGQVKKESRNPLFGEDKPWEPRFDNLYANVLFDQQEQIYKCWYSPFIVDPGSTQYPPGQREGVNYPRSGREMGICYAISRDGITWEKPDLGLVEFDGSTSNNLIRRGPHGAGIYRDQRDPDPQRRYKMLFKDMETGLSVAFSGDGLHWSAAQLAQGADVRGDTHNNALWAPTLNHYVGITRTRSEEKGRQVARITSNDFVNWSEAEVVLEGLELNLQTYAMPVFYHGGIYLGLVAIHDQQQDRVWTELAWSADTITWHRVLPGVPLIGNAEEPGAYDWGCVYAAAYPVFLPDEIRLYYSGSDGRHTSWRKGYLCLATLRPDGFAGYEPVVDDASAFITTMPLQVGKRALCLSADVEDGGFVRVAVLDEAGNYLIESQDVTKTVSDGRVPWHDANDPATYGDTAIRLRFELRKATLYSFSFQDE